MRLIALLLMAAMAMVSHAGDAHHQPSLEADLRELSNEDIDWDGNWLGLWPNLSDRASRIADAGAKAIGPLKRALCDPDKYVAAHVLLTRMDKGPYCVSGSAFNGLRVTLYADGRTEIADQREAVAEIWSSSPPKRPPCEEEARR